jgi:hypothetical protein
MAMLVPIMPFIFVMAGSIVMPIPIVIPIVGYPAMITIGWIGIHRDRLRIYGARICSRIRAGVLSVDACISAAVDTRGSTSREQQKS